MEPEDSLPHSQDPANSPYPEATRSSPCPHISFPEDLSSHYPPIYAWISQVVYFLQVSQPHSVYPSLPHRRCMWNHLILLDLITRKKLGERYRSLSSLLYSFSPLPFYRIHLSHIYSPQPPIHKHPPTTFFPQCARQSFTPIQNNRQNHISVYLNFQIFGQQTSKQKILHRIVASIPWLQFAKLYTHTKQQLNIIWYLFFCTCPKYLIFVFKLPINLKSLTNLWASSK